MTAVEEAQGVVAELEATVARWAAEAATKDAEAEGLEGRSGALLLDDPEAGQRLADDLAALRSAARMAGNAAAEADRRLSEARRGLLRAQAGELREAAERIRGEAAGRQKKTDRLLAQLRAHEDVEYGVAAVPVYASGLLRDYYPRSRSAVMLDEAEGLEVLAREVDVAAAGGGEIGPGAVAKHLATAANRLAAVA